MAGAEATLLFREAAEAATVAERQRADLAEVFDALGGRLRALDPPVVITCARGSSDHAATFAKYLIETRARTPVASYAPSVSSLYHTAWRKLDGALFLAISQSGGSPDLVMSATAAREAGALVVAVVNVEDSPLAAAADIVVPMLAGAERSVAATKSYIASLLAIVSIVAAWTRNDELAGALARSPDALRRAWSSDWSAAIPVLADAGSCFILGRGLTFGPAQEAALKLKETCRLHAEAFSAAEVRHGPMALVGPAFPVLMLAPQDEGRQPFETLAADFAARGAPVMVAGATPPGAVALPVGEQDPVLAPIAAIQSFYRLVAELSLARGLDPDRPVSLEKVTRTR